MTKSITPWVNSNKGTTSWVQVGRTASSWSNGSPVQVPYSYDSPTVTYDNAYSYDYITPIANQLNTKNSTVWAG